LFRIKKRVSCFTPAQSDTRHLVSESNDFNERNIAEYQRTASRTIPVVALTHIVRKEPRE
jgi:hypothetical protein